MFEGFEHKIVNVDGIAISCKVAGAGAPVLLLHGYPQNMSMWAEIAPQLAKRHQVVCADLRGYGDSAKPHSLPDFSNYSFRAMAADQLGLMRILGHDRFHVIGHDRGGRVAHRMALDAPGAVLSVSLLDIVPTWAMFMDVDRQVAGAYWHWYFLSQPEPFPERLIGLDPDFIFETCLTQWGKAKIADFDPKMIEAYRKSWRDPAMIHASSADYRAAASIDLAHDQVDIDAKIACPALILFGSDGLMGRLFDIPAEWRKRCQNVTAQPMAGAHFFPDISPGATSEALMRFLG